MMLTLLLLIQFLTGILGIKIVNFDVPKEVDLGDPVWLNCSYDLQSDKLYSIKWYKNQLEFYRYVPSYRPQGLHFSLEGVYADISRSYEGYLYFYKTDQFSNGLYRCEVAADAPSFQTVSREGDLFISYSTTPVAPLSSEDLVTTSEEMSITTKSESDELFEKTVKKLNFELSENEHFGLSISRSLDKMPEEKASETKIKIMQILHAKRFGKTFS